MRSQAAARSRRRPPGTRYERRRKWLNVVRIAELLTERFGVTDDRRGVGRCRRQAYPSAPCRHAWHARVHGRRPDRLLGSVLSLMPLEPVQIQLAGEAEEGASQAVVTKYERSAINRAACIELQGTGCTVCGVDFAAVYGPIGFGYVEVHHVEPIASLAPGTILDPPKDLVPLCSNCHSMAHKRSPHTAWTSCRR